MPAPRNNKVNRASSDRMTKMGQSYYGGYEGTPASQRKAGSKTVGFGRQGQTAPRSRTNQAKSSYPTKNGRDVFKGPKVIKKTITTPKVIKKTITAKKRG